MSSYGSKLNKDFFKQVVHNHNKWKLYDFEIESVDLTNASGDGYVGVLLRAKVIVKRNLTKETFSYIIKAPTGGVLDEESAKMLGDADKELKMYSKIIPAFESIWKRAGENINFSPKCYGVFHYPMTCIVMQDLSVDKYIVKPKPKGLDLTHALLVMERIAKFHAASVIYLQENGPFEDMFKHGFYDDNIPNHPMKDFSCLSKEAFCKSLKNWTGFEKEYEIIKKWKGSEILKNICTAIQNDPEGLTVLCHGDLWINNILFAQNSDGMPIDAQFIDFQVPFYSSPTCDILFFITMSLEEDVRIEEFDKLIQHYWECMSCSLKKLEYKGHIPTLKELQNDVLRRSSFAARLIFLNFSAFICDEGTQVDLMRARGLTEDAEIYRQSLFTYERYIRVASKFLKFLAKRGALDMPSF